MIEIRYPQRNFASLFYKLKVQKFTSIKLAQNLREKTIVFITLFVTSQSFEDVFFGLILKINSSRLRICKEKDRFIFKIFEKIAIEVIHSNSAKKASSQRNSISLYVYISCELLRDRTDLAMVSFSSKKCPLVEVLIIFTHYSFLTTKCTSKKSIFCLLSSILTLAKLKFL